MKKQLLIITLFIIVGLRLNAQKEHCGTMQNLAEMIKQDSSLKEKIIKNEIRTQEWLKNNGRLKQEDGMKPNSEKQNNENSALKSLCGYDNNYFTTIAASTVLNQIVSPNPNCTYGGEFVTLTGLIAGNCYRISTCGVNDFDTQISIYTSGGGLSVAHNDDFCGSQSEILFNPLVSGDYDVLIDEYNCVSNSICASLEVELIYTPRPVVTIPVIVHVIHNGEAIGTGTNLSFAQIQSQIDVLNEDFRRLNGDIYITPAAFRGISDDPLIEFCLAQQDESGNPTTGYERINGGQANWTMDELENTLKPATIWDRDSYLNLWTCDFGGVNSSLLGYAQFPAIGSANTDGVVIKYSAFGNTGNVNSPYDLGRTASHEVGHWLNLRHIWGDAAGCATDDLVSDTPIQDVSTSGTPTFPLLDACSVSYPGIMFFNNMDYSHDATLTMFTYGQASRMDAALFTDRVSLLSSVGCNPPSSGIDESSIANSVKIFPNPSSGYFTIQMNDKLKASELKIVNGIGETILSKNLTGNLEEINLSELSNGIYFLSITSSNGIFNEKLILNKQK